MHTPCRTSSLQGSTSGFLSPGTRVARERPIAQFFLSTVHKSNSKYMYASMPPTVFAKPLQLSSTTKSQHT